MSRNAGIPLDGSYSFFHFIGRPKGTARKSIGWWAASLLALGGFQSACEQAAYRLRLTKQEMPWLAGTKYSNRFKPAY
jgi:hypothetical protein